jgi:putative mycofactocin binding protein MftB
VRRLLIVAAFDLERPWSLSSAVALRPEPFGALAYDFGTRRLSFLKTKKLLGVVQLLAEQPTAHAACVGAGVTDAELPLYEQALAGLAAKGMITRRTAA